MEEQHAAERRMEQWLRALPASEVLENIESVILGTWVKGETATCLPNPHHTLQYGFQTIKEIAPNKIIQLYYFIKQITIMIVKL